MSRASFIASITGQPRRVCVQQIARDVSRAYAAGMSLTCIGAAMRRDHTSVLNGIRRASEKMRENAKISVDLRRDC